MTEPIAAGQVQAVVPSLRADNVVEALRRVIDEMPGIGKDGHAAPAQGGYAYRGIDQITREAQPLFAKHGVVFVPMVDSWERDNITVGGKPWTDDRLTVRYRIYGPGGRDDYIELVAPSVGRDNSDKGTNKAMTQAFKYALLQVLCISDPADDNDGTNDEADSYTPPPPEPMATAEQVGTLLDRLLAAKVAAGQGLVPAHASGYPQAWVDSGQALKVETLQAMANGNDVTVPLAQYETLADVLGGLEAQIAAGGPTTGDREVPGGGESPAPQEQGGAVPPAPDRVPMPSPDDSPPAPPPDDVPPVGADLCVGCGAPVDALNRRVDAEHCQMCEPF